jgi:hypothetical protein
MTLTPEEGRRLHVLTLLGSSAHGNADELSAPTLRAQRCGAGWAGGHLH